MYKPEYDDDSYKQYAENKNAFLRVFDKCEYSLMVAQEHMEEFLNEIGNHWRTSSIIVIMFLAAILMLSNFLGDVEGYDSILPPVNQSTGKM